MFCPYLDAPPHVFVFCPQVSARDAQDATTVTFVAVAVLDVNEPPVFPASLATTLTVSKLATAGYPILRLNVQDPEGTNVRVSLQTKCVSVVAGIVISGYVESPDSVGEP